MDNNAVASETDMMAIGIPVRLAIDRFKLLNTIYPESQNMGRPTTKPVILIASGAKRLPNFFNRKAAITVVLPVYSSRSPSVVPSAMINPKDFMMLPKPVFIRSTTASNGFN